MSDPSPTSSAFTRPVPGAGTATLATPQLPRPRVAPDDAAARVTAPVAARVTAPVAAPVATPVAGPVRIGCGPVIPPLAASAPLTPQTQVGNALLEAAFAASSTPTCLIECVDGMPRIGRANAAYVRLSGWSALELNGADPLQVTGGEADPAALDVLRKALVTGAGARVSMVASTRTGAAYWCEVTVLPVRDVGRRVMGAVMEHRDLTRELAAEARGWRGHHVDAITGLAARSLVDAEITRLCTGAMSFALLSCALTGLEQVNTVEGEAAGDDLLATAGRRIAELVGVAGRVGRHTGAGYAVIMEGAGREAGNALAGHIEQAFSDRPLQAESPVGISVGCAVFPDDARSASALQHVAVRQREEVRRLGVSRWSRWRG